MLKLYVKGRDLVERLRTDRDGVVSLEYLIVAACVVAVVAAAYGTTAGGTLGKAITGGLNAIATEITAAT